MLPLLQSRRIINISFLLFAFTMFKVSHAHNQFTRTPNFISRRYLEPVYYLPEECYGSYPRKPYFCKEFSEKQSQNVYYFIPEVNIPSASYSIPNYRTRARPRPKRRRPTFNRFPSKRELERRYHKLWLTIRPTFIYLKSILAELPPPVKSIPILMTVARTAVMVKQQIDEVRRYQKRLEESEEESMEIPLPPPPLHEDADKQAKQDKLLLDTQIVGLIAESLNLASNKLSLINTLARTAMVAGQRGGQFGGGGGGGKIQDSERSGPLGSNSQENLLDQLTENDDNIINALKTMNNSSSLIS